MAIAPRIARSGGFSFVELLVVTVIIGILAAIAIPQFLNQTEKADVAAAKTLVRTAAAATETVYADTEDHTAITTAALEKAEPAIDFDGGSGLSRNDAVTFTATPDGYALASTTEGGVTYTLTKDLSKTPIFARTDSEGRTW